MACGVPVIATTNTGGPDVITDGKDGFIVPIRDAGAIAERLEYLYRNPDARAPDGTGRARNRPHMEWVGAIHQPGAEHLSRRYAASTCDASQPDHDAVAIRTASLSSPSTRPADQYGSTEHRTVGSIWSPARQLWDSVGRRLPLPWIRHEDAAHAHDGGGRSRSHSGGAGFHESVLVVAELGLPDAVVRYVGAEATTDAAPGRTVYGRRYESFRCRRC